MRIRSLSIAVMLAVMPTAGWAVTVQYFFAGAPYSIANLPKEERPLFTTGYLSIDTARVNGDLAGSTLTGTYNYNEDRPEWSPAVSGFQFNNLSEPNLFWEFSVSFNAQRQISDWDFRHEHVTGTTVSITSGRASGLTSPHYYGHFPDYPPAYSVAEDLQQLGYRPGTPEYERLVQEWSGNSLYKWRAEGAGQWTDDPLAFARQVEQNTRQALADPARSFNDIPPVLEPVPSAGPKPVPTPVPLPAPVALMLGGFGLLGFVRRRAAVVIA